MALVDYTSGSSDSEEQPPTKSKKRKAETSPDASPPPLPPAFHDLYASTVRQAPTDDPALHQGRTRRIPHVAGNWPSHLYVEWHPSATQHVLLSRLLDDLRLRLDRTAQITTLLTSDLNVPQPLHISLSRPFVLSTSTKDGFLARVERDIAAGGVAPFRLRCRALEWHRTGESDRSFLVLRVGEVGVGAGAEGTTKGDADVKDQSGKAERNPNPRLTRLLDKCNAAVRGFDQPELYRWATGHESGVCVGDAFHVSIAWSFVDPEEGELSTKTAELLSEKVEYAGVVMGAEIGVDGIKAKIGNVVTHIPLMDTGRRGRSTKVGDLFGA